MRNILAQNRVISMLWFLTVLSSQFYIFASGTLQPSHILMLLLFIIYLIRRKISFKFSGKQLYLVYVLFIFFVYSVFQSLFWTLFEEDNSFIYNQIYWAFSLFIFSFLLAEINEKVIVEGLRFGSFVGIVILMIMWLGGFGRYEFGFRFNGYFNDPNQMAFWVMCSFCIFFFFSDRSYRYSILMLSFTSIFLILTTGSRSGLLGSFFLLLGSVARFSRIGERLSLSKLKHIFTFFLILLFLFPLTQVLLKTEVSQQALDRFLTTDFKTQADNRGYNRIIDYPEYLIFGAGNGKNERFGTHVEIHSTWIAILFYYGIFGFLMFICLVVKIFAKLNYIDKLVFLSPMLYSFSTYSARTPIFWFFVVSAVFAGGKNKLRPVKETGSVVKLRIKW